jgi:hypothetical protein
MDVVREVRLALRRLSFRLTTIRCNLSEPSHAGAGLAPQEGFSWVSPERNRHLVPGRDHRLCV